MTSSFICIKRAATISLFSLSPDVAGLEPKWHLALFPPRRCCTSLQPRSPIFSISGFPVTSSPARLFARYAGNASKHVFPSRKPQEIPSMEPFLHPPASQPGHHIYPQAHQMMLPDIFSTQILKPIHSINCFSLHCFRISHSQFQFCFQ